MTIFVIVRAARMVLLNFATNLYQQALGTINAR